MQTRFGGGHYDRLGALNVQICPNCQLTSDFRASVCPHCTFPIPEWARLKAGQIDDVFTRVLWIFSPALLVVIVPVVLLAGVTCGPSVSGFLQASGLQKPVDSLGTSTTLGFLFRLFLYYFLIPGYAYCWAHGLFNIRRILVWVPVSVLLGDPRPYLLPALYPDQMQIGFLNILAAGTVAIALRCVIGRSSEGYPWD